MNLNDIREERGGTPAQPIVSRRQNRMSWQPVCVGWRRYIWGRNPYAVDVGHWLQRGRWAGEIDPSNTFTCPRSHLPPIKGDGDGTTDCKSGGTAMDRAALD
jgi:hypothetical protein